jgi:tripartite-type tricarboxylate transporter receptor subunit TctC
MRSLTRRIVIAGFAAAASAGSAFAQTYDRLTKVILPVGAGSGVDAIVRTMSNGLAKALGQQLVIENLPGAGGIVGTAQLVKAPKDGQTIAVVSNNHVVNPSLYADMPFDPIADITPISVLGHTPFVLLAHPSAGVANVQELIAAARAKPGQINYGSSGNGTILHLAGELLASEARIKLQHVPYRSAGQLIQDLLGGHIQLGFFGANVAAQHVKSGTLRALGMSPRERSPLLPDVPTIAEQGLPNYAIDGWFAAIGPAKLPPADVARLHKAFATALSSPDIRDALVAQGNTIDPSTPDQAARYFREERDKMTRLVKEAGIKID